VSIVWRIALRNLQEHRAKSLIVGVIILIGTFVLVVGNSLMDSAAAGIRRSFIDNFTGHLVLAGVTDAPVSLFGVRSTDFLNTRTPRLDGYDRLLQTVAGHPDVAAWSAQAGDAATVSLAGPDGTSDGESFSQIWGIEPVSYREVFPDAAELIAGSFLLPEQVGLLLSEEIAADLAASAGREVQPGDRVLLTATTQAGIKVREVPVTGIFRFRNALPQLDFVSLVDITTLRTLTGMTVSAPAEQILTAEQVAGLGDVSEDDLFGGGGADRLVEEVESDSAPAPLDLGGREATVIDSGAWHFLLVKLHRPGAAGRVTAELEQVIAEADLNAQVLGWVEAAAPLSQLSDGFKIVFNVVIIVIAVAAVIVIMNTLVISVTERISEIGTMRAIGARKGFVRRMIGAETVTLAFVFGAAGVVLALLLLAILGATGIRAGNLFLRILFGGEVLRPAISLGAVAFSLLMVAAIAVLSSLYPLAVALRISPRQAMGVD
jgi:putative ABC transport system permease protein